MPAAKVRPTPAAPAPPPAPPASSASDPTGAELPGDLDAILSELGTAAAVISLWRVTASGRPAYLGRVPAGEFSLDGVRAEHGGGTYQARVIGADERIRRQTTFAIDGPARGAGAPPAADAARLDRLEAALVQLAERVAVPAPRAPERDPLDLAIKLAEVMRPAVAAAPTAPTGLSLADVLALVNTTRAEAIQLGKELAGAAPDHDGTAGLTGMVGQLVPPILSLAKRDVAAREQRNHLAARALATRTNAPAGAAAGAAPAALQPGLQSDDAPAPAMPNDTPAAPLWLGRVKPFAGTLAGWAAKDCDPETYAVFILDNLDEASVAQLEGEAAAPDFVDRTADALAGVSPKLAPHRAWLGRLVAEIHAQLTSADDAGEASTDEAAA